MKIKKTVQAVITLSLILLLTGCSATPAGNGDSKTGAESNSNGSTTITDPDTSPANEDNGSQESATSDSAEFTEMYKAILQGKAEFFSVDANKNLNISQLNQAVSADSGTDVRAVKYTDVDLDSDGTPEIILSLTVNGDDYYGFEVLHYQKETFYGYTLSYRSMMDLKSDGTFSFSSGAADSGFGTLKFLENTCEINNITYSVSSYDSDNNMSVSYYVDYKSAAEDQFQAAVKQQSEKADAIWSDLNEIQ